MIVNHVGAEIGHVSTSTLSKRALLRFRDALAIIGWKDYINKRNTVIRLADLQHLD